MPKKCRTPSHTHTHKHMCTEYEANLHAYPWHYSRNCQADFPTPTTSTGISGLGCALKVPTSCCDSQMGCGTHSHQADRRRSTFCRKRKKHVTSFIGNSSRQKKKTNAISHHSRLPESESESPAASSSQQSGQLQLSTLNCLLMHTSSERREGIN